MVLHYKIYYYLKNFFQKGNDLFVRREVVKDALEVICDVRDKNIIIVDDIFSSGSTR